MISAGTSVLLEPRLSELDKVISKLVGDYATGIRGKQPFIGKTMEIAYEKGVRDALEWVRAFNEANRETKKEESSLIIA